MREISNCVRPYIWIHTYSSILQGLENSYALEKVRETREELDTGGHYEIRSDFKARRT